ncbi:hypothetical protein [Leucobacter sp. USHLN153]|uniref:hypothetical protein n=1 Tax=Leucobacter sp. USHLN153 TaxID=3081268 RepID=UPI0030174774
MQEFVGSALGWVGTAGTFAAYVLMLRGTWTPSMKRYLVLNTAGGLFAAAGALAYGAWPSMVSNVVWAVMGGYGLIVALRATRSAELTQSVPVVTAVLPLPSTPEHRWDPSCTAAEAISLPWLPRAANADRAGEAQSVNVGLGTADPHPNDGGIESAGAAVITELDGWRETRTEALTA